MGDITHPDFTQGQIFDLVRTCAPVYGGHKALPDTLDELCLRKWHFFLSALDGRDYLVIGFSKDVSACAGMSYLVGRLFAFTKFGEILDDAFFHDGILLLGPPIGHLRQSFFLEVIFKSFAFPLVGWEECRKIFDTTTLQRAGEMIHRLIDQVGTEDESDHADGYVLKVVSGQSI